MEVLIPRFFVAVACIAGSACDAEPSLSYDVSVVSAESTLENVHVVIHTAPKAWVKVTDPSGHELKNSAKPTRGNADADGNFEFDLLKPKPTNAVTILAHKGTEEKVRSVIEVAYNYSAPPPKVLPSFSLAIGPSADSDASELIDCSGKFDANDKAKGTVGKCRMLPPPNKKAGVTLKGPPSATVVFAGEKTQLSADGGGALTVDLSKAMGGMSIKKFGFSSFDFALGVPVDMTLSTGEQLKGHVSLNTSIAPILKGKGMTFGADDVDEGDKTMLVIEPEWKQYVLGDTRTQKLRDVDLIAILTPKVKTLEQCRYGKRGDRVKKRIQHDSDVKLYNRRTGRKVASKYFKADKPGPCATAVSKSQAEHSIYSRAEKSTIDKWLKSHL